MSVDVSAALPRGMRVLTKRMAQEFFCPWRIVESETPTFELDSIFLSHFNTWRTQLRNAADELDRITAQASGNRSDFERAMVLTNAVRNSIASVYDHVVYCRDRTPQTTPNAVHNTWNFDQVIDDLMAIHDDTEFEGVYLWSNPDRNSSDKQIRVKTKPIHLEYEGRDGRAEVDLGKFYITLNNKLDPRYGKPVYRVKITGEDNLQAHGGRVYHPHVHADEHVCTGVLEGPVNRALNEGRISEWLTLVHQVLLSYNHGSPYHPLTTWHRPRPRCIRCNTQFADDQVRRCSHCRNNVCNDCIDNQVCVDCNPEGNLVSCGCRPTEECNDGRRRCASHSRICPTCNARVSNINGPVRCDGVFCTSTFCDACLGEESEFRNAVTHLNPEQRGNLCNGCAHPCRGCGVRFDLGLLRKVHGNCYCPTCFEANFDTEDASASTPFPDSIIRQRRSHPIQPCGCRACLAQAEIAMAWRRRWRASLELPEEEQENGVLVDPLAEAEAIARREARARRRGGLPPIVLPSGEQPFGDYTDGPVPAGELLENGIAWDDEPISGPVSDVITDQGEEEEQEGEVYYEEEDEEDEGTF